jgi:hypothetical protein
MNIALHEIIPRRIDPVRRSFKLAGNEPIQKKKQADGSNREQDNPQDELLHQNWK